MNRRHLALMPMLLLGGLAACVQWRPVATQPTPAPTAARTVEQARWVRVTTRDSARYLLEDAAFHDDTLVGRGSDARGADSLVRVRAADIAHLEARVPSLSGSAGVAALVLGGITAFAWGIGHLASR